MAAWEVTDRVREDDDSGGHLDWSKLDTPRSDHAEDDAADAHLEDLINEDSAATADFLEEQERARAAALATAPIRAASASRQTLGKAVSALTTGTTAALSATADAVGLAGRVVGGAIGSVRERFTPATTPVTESSAETGARIARRPVHRPARRVGLAALAALVMAAPAAGAPAPWATLVGASIGRIGGGDTPGGVPGDLFSPKALGPLPSTLPARGLTETTTPGIDTAANPEAAGLPIGNSDRSIPSTVLLAYQKAADRMAVLEPGCQLNWPLLAGIGKVESNHGRSWGGSEHLTANGTVTPPILGPVLDGSTPGTATLKDTDQGRLDGNKQFDRAVGPMQFVPGTWKLLGQDGNGDGVADPNNIWDASLSTATFLCSGNRDLGNPAQQAAAVFAYNPSAEYVRTVLAWSVAYGTGATVDLSLPTGGIVLPPEITGGTPGIQVPLVGTFSPYNGVPYADPEPGAAGAGSGFTSTPAPSGTSTKQPPRGPTNSPPSPPSPPTNPTPSAPPTKKPTPTPSSPNPSPNPNPTPNPEPKFGLTLNAVTATRAKTDASDDYDAVTVTATITATTTGHSDVELTLVGKDGHRVTGKLLKNVAFAKGSKSVEFEVDGGYLGDSGVDGPYTASIEQQETKADGTHVAAQPTPLGTSHTIGSGWKAEEFADYAPSLQRVWNRVDEFNGLGMLDDATRTKLQHDLGESDLTTVKRDFQQDLTAAKAHVPAETFTRLSSLVDRLTADSAGPAPSHGKTAPPGPDPVRGPAGD